MRCLIINVEKMNVLLPATSKIFTKRTGPHAKSFLKQLQGMLPGIWYQKIFPHIHYDDSFCIARQLTKPFFKFTPDLTLP